jgi:hypothetical protein
MTTVRLCFPTLAGFFLLTADLRLWQNALEGDSNARTEFLGPAPRVRVYRQQGEFTGG